MVEGGGVRPVVVWRSPWPVALLATAFLLVGVREIVSRFARILGLPGGLGWFLDYGVVTGLLMLLAAGWWLAWPGRFPAWLASAGGEPPRPRGRARDSSRPPA